MVSANPSGSCRDSTLGGGIGKGSLVSKACANPGMESSGRECASVAAGGGNSTVKV